MSTTQNNNIRTVFVNVTGTHPQTRGQKCVFKRFDGMGREINQDSSLVGGAPSLEGLNVSSTTPPAYPQDEFNEAAKVGDYARMQGISLAHAEQVQAWQASQQGGTDETRIAKAVLAYCYQHQGFLAEDGDGFVLKLENLDVKRDELKEGGVIFTVSGTAVFGQA